MSGWTEESLRSDALKFGVWKEWLERLFPSDFCKDDWIPDSEGAPPPQSDNDGPKGSGCISARGAFGHMWGSGEYYTGMLRNAEEIYESIADGVIDMALLKAMLLSTVIAFIEGEEGADEEVVRLRQEIADL
ncbi:MAG: hypothetical protein LBE83_01640 [Propionibacteriaceae bacterium]|jgi:hypothetical protein|nr:hypothetical protein [Propionibacteriaceae bacterium]